MLPLALGTAAGVLALAVLVLFLAGRARARALADDIRTEIEPYLRHRAARAGLPAAAPPWTARSGPEEIAAYSTRLAVRLLDQERAGVEAASTANTQPISSDTLALAETQATPPPLEPDEASTAKAPR